MARDTSTSTGEFDYHLHVIEISTVSDWTRNIWGYAGDPKACFHETCSYKSWQLPYFYLAYLIKANLFVPGSCCLCVYGLSFWNCQCDFLSAKRKKEQKNEHKPTHPKTRKTTVHSPPSPLPLKRYIDFSHIIWVILVRFRFKANVEQFPRSKRSW